MKMKYLSAMDAEFALTQFQNKGWANWSRNDLKILAEIKRIQPNTFRVKFRDWLHTPYEDFLRRNFKPSYIGRHLAQKKRVTKMKRDPEGKSLKKKKHVQTETTRGDRTPDDMPESKVSASPHLHSSTPRIGKVASSGVGMTEF